MRGTADGLWNEFDAEVLMQFNGLGAIDRGRWEASA